MSLPSAMFPTTCDVYRPFGSGSSVAAGVACRHAIDPGGIRDGGLYWTEYLDVDASVDVRDGLTRIPGVNGMTFADGDEVRIPNASGSRYVVVWVAVMNRGTDQAFKRVYLLRDTAVWPGP